MIMGKIKQLVLPHLPYVLLLWFFSKLGEAYRLSDESETLFRILDVVSNLSKVIQNPAPTFYPFDLLVGTVGVAAIFCFVQYKKANAKKWRKDIEYGSARWGTKKDIAHYVDPNPYQNVILTATESLMLNSRPKNPKYARNKNVLVIGGSGSGKTRFFLKPNLMQAHSSYCITDPKGTLILECGKFLKRAGYEIKVLNTIDFAKSMRYNPLAYIRSEKDILKLVTALIANTTPSDQKGGDPFWTKAETLLYCALIGYIHYEAAEEEKNLNSLVEMINAMEVREDDETYKNAVDYLFEELEKESPQHFAVRQYKKYLLAAGKTAKGILKINPDQQTACLSYIIAFYL